MNGAASGWSVPVCGRDRVVTGECRRGRAHNVRNRRRTQRGRSRAAPTLPATHQVRHGRRPCIPVPPAHHAPSSPPTPHYHPHLACQSHFVFGPIHVPCRPHADVKTDTPCPSPAADVAASSPPAPASGPARHMHELRSRSRLRQLLHGLFVLLLIHLKYPHAKYRVQSIARELLPLTSLR
jgi:hypothetical protein